MSDLKRKQGSNKINELPLREKMIVLALKKTEEREELVKELAIQPTLKFCKFRSENNEEYKGSGMIGNVFSPPPAFLTEGKYDSKNYVGKLFERQKDALEEYSSSILLKYIDPLRLFIITPLDICLLPIAEENKSKKNRLVQKRGTDKIKRSEYDSQIIYPFGGKEYKAENRTSGQTTIFPNFDNFMIPITFLSLMTNYMNVDNNYYHFDIKSDNVLYLEKENSLFFIDFGMASHNIKNFVEGIVKYTTHKFIMNPHLDEDTLSVHYSPELITLKLVLVDSFNRIKSYAQKNRSGNEQKIGKNMVEGILNSTPEYVNNFIRTLSDNYIKGTLSIVMGENFTDKEGSMNFYYVDSLFKRVVEFIKTYFELTINSSDAGSYPLLIKMHPEVEVNDTSTKKKVLKDPFTFMSEGFIDATTGYLYITLFLQYGYKLPIDPLIRLTWISEKIEAWSFGLLIYRYLAKEEQYYEKDGRYNKIKELVLEHLINFSMEKRSINKFYNKSLITMGLSYQEIFKQFLEDKLENAEKIFEAQNHEAKSPVQGIKNYEKNYLLVSLTYLKDLIKSETRRSRSLNNANNESGTGKKQRTSILDPSSWFRQ
jgi:hypothetical protein